MDEFGGMVNPSAFDVNFHNIKDKWERNSEKHGFFTRKKSDNELINLSFGEYNEDLLRTIDLLTNKKYRDPFVPDFLKGTSLETESRMFKINQKAEASDLLSKINDPTINKVLDVDPKYFGKASPSKIHQNLDGKEDKIVERLNELRENLSKMNPEDFQLKSQGKLYEMDFDAEFYELLDWDKPMSQQSDFVKERIGKIVDDFDLNDMQNLGIELYDLHNQLRGTNFKRILRNIMEGEKKTKEEAYKIIDDMFPNGILAHKAEKEMQFDIGGTGFAPYTNPNYLKAKDVDKIFEIIEKQKDIANDFAERGIPPIGGEYEKVINQIMENELLPIFKNYAKKSLLSSDGGVQSFLNDMNYMKGKHNAGELASRDLGIKGIMYNAGGSRKADMKEEDRIKNFVTFNDRDLEIIKKYGLLASPLIAGVGLLGNDNDRPN
ncbi:MAG: hypothetical protein CMP92_00240 [Gammaproteobacteria bacterium]|nr:hypothetical protein [Gammaproteobacteria bacterium]